jgi:hypothetical protein
MSHTVKQYLTEKYFRTSGLSADDLCVDQVRFFKSLEKKKIH